VKEGQSFDQNERLALNRLRSQPRWEKGNPGPGPGSGLVSGRAGARVGQWADFLSLKTFSGPGLGRSLVHEGAVHEQAVGSFFFSSWTGFMRRTVKAFLFCFPSFRYGLCELED
jgi:hypothetical protein